jgi:hypothetical protein
MSRTDRELIQWENRHGANLPIPPKKKRRDNEESRSQQALIQWWSRAHAGFGVPEEALFAVGNGGARSPVTGAIMKREGVRRGTSDLILLCMRKGFGALCIEMKAERGTLSQEQRVFLINAFKRGYCTATCYSTQDAIAAITEYLNQ